MSTTERMNDLHNAAGQLANCGLGQVSQLVASKLIDMREQVQVVTIQITINARLTLTEPYDERFGK
jgi:hypothetical protein